MARDEVDAAYFTLLRAREELDGVRRYGEYLRDEARRLRRSLSEGQALADTVDRRLRRPLRHTDQPLEEAIRGRLAVIEEELGLLPDREAAAEAFVEECEREHTQLRGGR
jgi:predicted RNase H-like nuclease